MNQAVRGDACQMQIRATAFGLSKERYAQGLSDLEILVRFFSGTAMTTLFEFPWAPLYLIMIYLMMPALGVVVTVGGLIMVGLSLLKSRVVGDISPSLSEEKKRQKQWTSTVLRNAEAINAMGMFQRVNDITESRLATLSRHETIAAKASTTLNALVGGMQLFIQLSIYFVGALLALKYGADFQYGHRHLHHHAHGPGAADPDDRPVGRFYGNLECLSTTPLFCGNLPGDFQTTGVAHSQDLRASHGSGSCLYSSTSFHIERGPLFRSPMGHFWDSLGPVELEKPPSVN